MNIEKRVNNTWRQLLTCCTIILLTISCENLTEVNQDLNMQSETTDVKSSRTMVEICHVNGRGDYRKITIAEAAYEAHIAHGDAAIGDAVPGLDGFIFGDNCEIEEEESEIDLCLVEVPGFGIKNCCDEIDNNDSGLTDCFDPVCQEALVCQ